MENHHMTTLQLPVVGATFRPAEAKEALKSLSPGDSVELRADPNNEYDATAVAVWSGDHHIGFIPATDNGPVFKFLWDNDTTLDAEIIAFQSTLKPVIEFELPSDTALGDQPEFEQNAGDD
jgi:hypothetical protein